MPPLKRAAASRLPPAAERLLLALAAPPGRRAGRRPPADSEDVACLIVADLAARTADAGLAVTAAGRAYVARLSAVRSGSGVDPFLAQHIVPALRTAERPEGRVQVTVDAMESPLAWLARRKGRDGRLLIAPEQLQAGERLRAEFTRAQLTPRVTSNWSANVAMGRRDGGHGSAASDAIVAARQRVRRALDAVGPEFAGLLLDVCCFLKGLEDVERERAWPPRSAKVVLQLGLDRLARHYGLGHAARGRNQAALRTWLAPDAEFVVEEASER